MLGHDEGRGQLQGVSGPQRVCLQETAGQLLDLFKACARTHSKKCSVLLFEDGERDGRDVGVDAFEVGEDIQMDFRGLQ